MATDQKYGSISAEKTYSMEEAMDAIGFGRFHVFLIFIIGSSWLGDAMELLIMSLLPTVLACEWELQTWQSASLTTVVFVGIGIGSPIWGWFSDKYGRKKALVFYTLSAGFLACLSALAPTFPIFMTLRFATGLGLGGLPLSLTYFAEFLRTHARGKSILSFTMFWSIGSVLAVGLAWALMEHSGWRVFLAVSSLPLLLAGFAATMIPESPRYLATRNREIEASAILEKMARAHNRELPQGKLEGRKSFQRGKLKELFSKQHYVTTLLLIASWFLANFMYYGTVFLSTVMLEKESLCEDKGGNGTDLFAPLLCHIPTSTEYASILFTSLSEFPGFLITIVLIDIVGRKKTIMLESLSYGVVMFLLCICMNRTGMSILLFFARGLTFGSFEIPYVITTEYYPTTLRGIGLGTTSAFGRVAVAITPYVAQMLGVVSVRYALIIYGTLGVLWALIALMFPVETMGKPMQEFSDSEPKVEKSVNDLASNKELEAFRAE